MTFAQSVVARVQCEDIPNPGAVVITHVAGNSPLARRGNG